MDSNSGAGGGSRTHTELSPLDFEMVHKVLENKSQLRKYSISAEMPHSKVSHPNVIEIHHRRFADLFPGVSEIGREPLNDKCLLSVGYIVFRVCTDIPNVEESSVKLIILPICPASSLIRCPNASIRSTFKR